MNYTGIQKLDQAAATVDALKSERDKVASIVTREDGERRADGFLEVARARAAGVAGFVAGGAAAGDPLAQVLAAYCLSRPDFRDFLVQGQQEMEGVGDWTDKKKASQLAKLDAEIEAATKDHLAAAKAVRLAELEAEFASVSGEAA